MVAGGRSPDCGWLKEAAQGYEGYEIWCIDRGADWCRRSNLAPDMLIGDLDSISTDTADWAREHSVQMKKYPPEKDFTDTQLAIDMAKEGEKAFILLTGCFGGRMDHLYSTIFSCAYSGLSCCLADHRETLFVLRGGQSLRLTCKVIPKALSLLPLSSACEGVFIDNVRWPLGGGNLAQRLPWAVSNRVLSETPVTVAVKTGILGVYACMEETIQQW